MGLSCLGPTHTDRNAIVMLGEGEIARRPGTPRVDAIVYTAMHYLRTPAGRCADIECGRDEMK